MNNYQTVDHNDFAFKASKIFHATDNYDFTEKWTN